MGHLDPPWISPFFFFFTYFCVYLYQIKTWHKTFHCKKNVLKKVIFWPSYGNFSDLNTSQLRFSAELTDFLKSLKKVQNAGILFLNDVQWRKGILTHQINVFWCVLQPFLFKNKNFQNDPPSPLRTSCFDFLLRTSRIKQASQSFSPASYLWPFLRMS